MKYRHNLDTTTLQSKSLHVGTLFNSTTNGIIIERSTFVESLSMPDQVQLPMGQPNNRACMCNACTASSVHVGS